MGGKGGGGGNAQYAQSAYDNAYAAAQRGTPYGAVMGQFTGRNEAFLPYAEAGYSAGAPVQPLFGGGGFGIEFPEFEPPDYGAQQAESQARFEAQQAEQQRRLEEQEAERRRIEGENRRDALYSDYLDAAGVATDFINQQITTEQSNAALLGIDYDITDEQKSARISNYFASIWGEGQQQQLEALMNEWGNPQGFEGFTIERGDADLAEGAPGEEEQVATGEGLRPRTVLEDEEEVLGGTTAILGT